MMANANQGRCVLTPVDPAWALALGSALASAASELPGAGVVGVTFVGQPTAYARAVDVLETYEELARRCSRLRVRHSGPPRWVTFAVGGPEPLTGARVAAATGFEVLTPDLVLATCGPRAALELTLGVACGHGWRAEPDGRAEHGHVPLAPRFTPLAGWSQRVDGERLVVEVVSDGQVTPPALLAAAARRLEGVWAQRYAGLTVRWEPCDEPRDAAARAPLTLGRAPRSLDLTAPVRAAFGRFLERLVPTALSARFPLSLPGGRVVQLAGVLPTPPPEPAEAALAAGETWCGGLLAVWEAPFRQRVPLARVPWMTARGTFVIDGQERALVRPALDLQLAAVLSRALDAGLPRLVQGVDEGVPPAALGDLLKLSAALLDWFRTSPDVVAADLTNPLAVALQVRGEPGLAERYGLAGGSQVPRALVPLAPELPLVATGLEREAAALATVWAPWGGRIEASDDDGLTLGERRLALPSFTRGRDAAWAWRLRAPVGSHLEAEELLVDGGGVVDAELACGANLLVGWTGVPGEVLLSASVVADDRLTTLHRRELIVPFTAEYLLTRVTARDPRHLDHRGVARPGFAVDTDEVLVGRLDRRTERDASLRCPAGGPWQVLSALEPPGGQRVVLSLASRRRLAVGDALASRDRELGRIARVVPVGDLPRLSDGRALDLLLPGEPGETRTEATLGLIAAATGRRIVVPPGNRPDARELGRLWQAAGLPAASRLWPGGLVAAGVVQVLRAGRGVTRA